MVEYIFNWINHVQANRQWPGGPETVYSIQFNRFFSIARQLSLKVRILLIYITATFGLDVEHSTAS